MIEMCDNEVECGKHIAIDGLYAMLVKSIEYNNIEWSLKIIQAISMLDDLKNY